MAPKKSPDTDRRGAVVLVGTSYPSAFAFPWWVLAKVVAGESIGQPGFRVPALVLLPATLDAQAADVVHEGEVVRPASDPRVGAPPSGPSSPGTVPPPFDLAAASTAAIRVLEACARRGVASADGWRRVAEAHPWTFLFPEVLGPALESLAPGTGLPWPACARHALELARAQPPQRGRPARVSGLNAALTLRRTVAFLVGRRLLRGPVAVRIEEQLRSAADRSRWPRAGGRDGAGRPYKKAADRALATLRKRGAEPLLLPFLLAKWPDRCGEGDDDHLRLWLADEITEAVLAVVGVTMAPAET